jgi:diguanylate cyclase (GGDEF)-like protein/PAS domain S-box-containing protein
LAGPVERWLEYVKPEDREALTDALAWAGSRGEEWRWVGRMTLPDRMMWVQGAATFVPNSQETRRWVGVWFEMPDPAAVEANRKAQEERRVLSLAVEQSPATIVLTDPEGVILYANPAFRTLTGWTPEEALGQPISILKSGQMPFSVYVDLWSTLRDGQEWRGEFLNKKKGGELFWEESYISPILSEDGTIQRFLAIKEDITDRKRHEESLNNLNSQLEDSVAELKRRDHETTLVGHMNDLLRACYSRAEAYRLIALSLREIFQNVSGFLAAPVPTGNAYEVVAEWGENLESPDPFLAEDCWALKRGHHHEAAAPDKGVHCRHFLRPPAGGYLCIPLNIRKTSLGMLHLIARPGERIQYSQVQLALSMTEAITLSLSNLSLQEALLEQAIRDPLTGLFNRRYLEETLGRELHRVQRTNTTLCLAMLDVDHFKSFNDNFGHEAGDEVLRALGDVFRDGLRKSDIPCRFGGEEFTIILPESNLENARIRVGTICKAFKALEIRSGGKLLPPSSLSAGIAIAPHHGITPEVLLRVADGALYAAKLGGRDRVAIAEINPSLPGAPKEA